MLRISVWLLVGVCVWDFASCTNTCPDGSQCSDLATCCMTEHGYSCCQYPKASCCADLAHCCPAGFRCNLVTMMCEKENQPWINIPMVKKEAAERPSLPVSPPQELQDNHVPDTQKSSVVHCDNLYTCPDGYTCCRHPKGVWFCCPYTFARCCLDGFHCCPYGYDCDLTYTHCVRGSLRYPFTPRQALSSIPASLISPPRDEASLQETPMTALTEARVGEPEAGVIHCDSKFYCPKGTSCCKGTKVPWNCCPYQLGKCCADGVHCCKHGQTCDPPYKSCSGFFSQVPSGAQQPARTD